MSNIVKYYLDTEEYMLTENFSNTEILNASHPDVGSDYIEMDKRVIDIAQYIRTEINKSISVNSAYRNPIYNASLPNSSSVSQHLKGRALDLGSTDARNFVFKAYEDKNEHYTALWNMGLRGIGYYSWGIHIDTRESTKMAVWGYVKKETTPIIALIIILIGVLIGISR